VNEASSLSIGVDEELPSFSAVTPVPMLTRSLQDRYLFRPPGARLSSLRRHVCSAAKVTLPNLRGHCQSGCYRVDDEYIGELEGDSADLIANLAGCEGCLIISVGSIFVRSFPNPEPDALLKGAKASLASLCPSKLGGKPGA
jgi:hypothetical protein